MSKSMKKYELISELSEQAFTTRKQTESIIESLIHIVSREAVNGFSIPGLCKFEVVERKARKGRNPQTGERIEIPATKSLKIRPLSKIKHATTAWLETADATEEEIAGDTAETKHESFFIFCPHCERKLEADSSMSGFTAECPFCMKTMTVPNYQLAPKGQPADAGDDEYVLFSCPMCKQAIEAPRKSADTRMSCPVCGAAVAVPDSTEMKADPETNATNELLGTTIRIDLPEN